MIEAYPNGKDDKGKQIIGIFQDGKLIDRLTMEQIAEMYKTLKEKELENVK